MSSTADPSRRALPRRWWLALPVVGLTAAVVSPIVYEQRHVPEELRAPAPVAPPSLERDLACAVEARCGPVRAEATLVLDAGAPPTVEPAGALPPGYAECAARVLADSGLERLALAPCPDATPRR